ATVDWDLSDSVSLRSISSYVDHKSLHDVDSDGTAADFYNTPGFTRPSESYAQEFTLSGDLDRIDWVVGAFYFHEEATVKLPLRIGSVLAPMFGVPTDSLMAQSIDSE